MQGGPRGAPAGHLRLPARHALRRLRRRRHPCCAGGLSEDTYPTALHRSLARGAGYVARAARSAARGPGAAAAWGGRRPHLSGQPKWASPILEILSRLRNRILDTSLKVLIFLYYLTMSCMGDPTASPYADFFNFRWMGRLEMIRGVQPRSSLLEPAAVLPESPWLPLE